MVAVELNDEGAERMRRFINWILPWTTLGSITVLFYCIGNYCQKRHDARTNSVHSITLTNTRPVTFGPIDVK
jgi:hypothetical protein